MLSLSDKALLCNYPKGLIPKCHNSRLISNNSRISVGLSVSVSTTLPNSKFRSAGSIQAYSPTTSKRNSSDFKVGECFVFTPPANLKPKAVISFVGGAFLGATPDIIYKYLIDLLRNRGFIVIATPYNVTFDHLECASSLYYKISNTIEQLVQEGIAENGIDGDTIASLPVVGLGHSNGALMHVLMGSLYPKENLPSANVVIAYNNKPAAEAVPYFDQVGPRLSQAAPAIQSFPLTGIALSFAEQALQEIERATKDLSPVIPQENLDSLARFTEQIIPVTSQVVEGVSEFRPTPSENRRTISSAYCVPKTLLVKFETDTLDETDTIYEILRVRTEETGGELRLVKLRGTHATPLAPELKWDVGEVYSALDAVGQFARGAALEDIHRLVDTVASWIEDSV